MQMVKFHCYLDTVDDLLVNLYFTFNLSGPEPAV